MSRIDSDQRYKIINEENGLVLDLSGADNKSILGWEFHGSGNQQWIIEQYDDNQWTVRSVRGQKYLGFETSAPQDGAPLVGLNRPRLWDIEFLPDSEDHDHPRVKLWVSDTLLVVEFPAESSSMGPLRLWTSGEGKNQVWLLEEYS